MTTLWLASDQKLVFISGPIASGKTTVAFKLASAARSRGETAASIDLDEMVEMVAGRDWSLVREEHRALASEVAATIADRFFKSGIKIVVVAGSTLSSEESEHLLQHMATKPNILSVLLRVSLKESIRRAQGDPSRVSTKNPAFVKRIDSSIDWSKLQKPDLEVVTDGLTLDEVVDVVAGRALSA